MKFIVHDPYPTLDELEEAARALAQKDGISAEAARDLVCQDLFDEDWSHIWAENGGTIEANVMTSKWDGITFQVLLPEDFQETGNTGIQDDALDVFIRPSITGFLDDEASVDALFTPGPEPVMELTVDGDPGNSGTFVRQGILGARRFSSDRPRHVVAGRLFEDIVSSFFEGAPLVDERPWQKSYGSLGDLLEHCDQIQEDLLRIEEAFGEQWAARLAYLMLYPCPWNPGAYSLAARDEALSVDVKLRLVREGFWAALIEAGGSLPPAGKEDDWGRVNRRQALRMKLREAEILEKAGRVQSAVRIYRELEARIPRDNLGLHGRAGATGRLN